jgi:hypothetical protein
MKQLLTICILLASLVGYSQTSYIGWDHKELKQEFPDLIKRNDIEGHKCYGITNSDGDRAFVMINDIVTITVFAPANEVRNSYIKYYNENYIKTAPKTWETYVNGGTIQVDLELHEGMWQFIYKPI